MTYPKIKTGPASREYVDNWDRIFGNASQLPNHPEVAVMCSWCLAAPATLRYQASDSCADCAASTPHERTTRWLEAVGKKNP